MTVYGARGGCESLIERPPTTLAYFTVSASPIQQVPLQIFMMCIFVGRLSVEIGFTTMSLAYGAELVVHQPSRGYQL